MTAWLRMRRRLLARPPATRPLHQHVREQQQHREPRKVVDAVEARRPVEVAHVVVAVLGRHDVDGAARERERRTEGEQRAQSGHASTSAAAAAHTSPTHQRASTPPTRPVPSTTRTASRAVGRRHGARGFSNATASDSKLPSFVSTSSSAPSQRLSAAPPEDREHEAAEHRRRPGRERGPDGALGCPTQRGRERTPFVGVTRHPFAYVLISVDPPASLPSILVSHPALSLWPSTSQKGEPGVAPGDVELDLRVTVVRDLHVRRGGRARVRRGRRRSRRRQ